MRIPSIIGCLFVLACGSDPADSPPVQEQPHCKALAKAWCERFYDCYTDDQIAAEGLPRTVGDCIRELELGMDCADPVPDTTCADGFELAADDAAACVTGVRGAVCSQLADVESVSASCDASCEPIPGACAAACNPADPGACGQGSACRIDDECGAICVDEVGTGTALDACRDDDDCAAGHTCSDWLCTQLCDASNLCGESRTCTGRAYPDAGVRECTDGCIPGYRECGADMTCALDQDTQPHSTECVAAGDGLQGGLCDSDSDCAVDFMCLVDPDGISRCSRGCDANNPCPAPERCYGWTPPEVIRGVTIGHCN